MPHHSSSYNSLHPALQPLFPGAGTRRDNNKIKESFHCKCKPHGKCGNQKTQERGRDDRIIWRVKYYKCRREEAHARMRELQSGRARDGDDDDDSRRREGSHHHKRSSHHKKHGRHHHGYKSGEAPNVFDILAEPHGSYPKHHKGSWGSGPPRDPPAPSGDNARRVRNDDADGSLKGGQGYAIRSQEDFHGHGYGDRPSVNQAPQENRDGYRGEHYQDVYPRGGQYPVHRQSEIFQAAGGDNRLPRGQVSQGNSGNHQERRDRWESMMRGQRPAHQPQKDLQQLTRYDGFPGGPVPQETQIYARPEGNRRHDEGP